MVGTPEALIIIPLTRAANSALPETVTRASAPAPADINALIFIPLLRGLFQLLENGGHRATRELSEISVNAGTTETSVTQSERQKRSPATPPPIATSEQSLRTSAILPPELWQAERLADILARIADHPAKRITELLPGTGAPSPQRLRPPDRDRTHPECSPDANHKRKPTLIGPVECRERPIGRWMRRLPVASSGGGLPLEVGDGIIPIRRH